MNSFRKKGVVKFIDRLPDASLTDLRCSGLSSVLALESIHQPVDRTSLRSSAHQNVHLNLQSRTADPVQGYQMMMMHQCPHFNAGASYTHRTTRFTSKINSYEIKTKKSFIYHENSHLESSPWSPHGCDERPAVLFGVITLHSPQTLLPVVTS